MNTDDELNKIISKYLHISKELLHLDEETVELRQAIQNLITKARIDEINYWFGSYVKDDETWSDGTDISFVKKRLNQLKEDK